LPEYNL